LYGATRWTKLLRPQDTDEGYGYGYDEAPEAICGGGYDDHEAWRVALERYPRVNATVCSPPPPPLLGALDPCPGAERESHRVGPKVGPTLGR
jgi:hypothetical protein